jgi:hypothetical protein
MKRKRAISSKKEGTAMRPIAHAALSLTLVLSCAVRAQPRPEAEEVPADNAFHLEPGRNAVGFRLLEGQDRSRAVTGGASATAHPRPVRTYVWYPARGTPRAMRFGRYAELADGDIWPAEISGSLRGALTYSHRPLARALGPAGYEALLRRPVLAAENADPLKGPFPLIVLGQGWSIEPAISLAALAEYLAGRGFVVVATPLVGTNSPIARVEAMDLETEVRDLEFAIARARELPFASPDKLAVIGPDMGGMAGLLLTMRNRDVDAFVGLPAGILFEHPSGLPRSAPGYDPLALRVPWLQIMPVGATTPPPGSSTPSLFETAVYSERYLLLTPTLAHTDVTIDGLIEGRSRIVGVPQSTPTGSEGQKAFMPYVLEFLTAFLGPDADGRAKALAFLSRAPEDAGWKMTLEHRPAAPASMTYEQFVEAVVAGRASEAIARLRSEAAVEPNHVILSQESLQRLSLMLLFTWGHPKEAIPVIELMMERYPEPGPPRLLAEARAASGDVAGAIDLYRKYLEQNPDDEDVRARLKELRKQ